MFKSKTGFWLWIIFIFRLNILFRPLVFLLFRFFIIVCKVSYLLCFTVRSDSCGGGEGSYILREKMFSINVYLSFELVLEYLYLDILEEALIGPGFYF